MASIPSPSPQIPRGFLLIKKPHEKLFLGLLQKAAAAGLSFESWAAQALEGIEAEDRLRKLPPPPEVVFADEALDEDDQPVPTKRPQVSGPRLRRRILTPDDETKICAEHGKGASVEALALRFRASEATIYRTLWKHNVPPHQPNRRSNK